MSTYINPQTGEPLAEESVAEETVTTDQEDAVDAPALENNVGDDDHAIEFYHKTTTRMPDEPVEQVGPASPYEAAEPFVPRTPDPSEWPMRERHYWLSNQEKIYLMLLPAITAALAIIMVVVFLVVYGAKGNTPNPPVGGSNTEAVENQPNRDENLEGLTPMVMGPAGPALLAYGNDSAVPSENIHSKKAAVAQLSDSPAIELSRLSAEKMYPASLTKVMTLVVAVEQLKYQEKLQDTVTVTEDTVNRMKAEGASGAGLEAGEKLTVEALLYALILKSDGVAACELANHIAGSEAAFVQLMNQKVAEMGLEGTHFVNPTGLHDEQQYSTCRDMASIMAYAMKIPQCEKILTALSYVAPCTQASGVTFNYTFYHSLLVTQFDKFKDQNKPYQPDGLTVVAGKTGYTPESGYCLVTCAKDESGKLYVCVTAGAKNYAECVEDYIYLYEQCN